MACCPSGSIGFLGLNPIPTVGSTVELSPEDAADNNDIPPLPCYTTGSGSKRIIIVFSDVYGMQTGNHKVFCDELSKRIPDATILLPDLFRGNPILMPWLTGYLSELTGSILGLPRMIYKLKFDYPPSVVEGNVRNLLLPYIRTTHPGAKVSCVGFCFGGWVVANVLAQLSSDFSAGVGIHPSFQLELLHGRSPVDLAERVQRPILLLPAKNDNHLHPGSEVTNILQSHSDEPVSILFEDMLHGWVSRGDGKKHPKVGENQEKAIQLTVDFLERHA